MKYNVEMIGWEYHIQTKNLSKAEVDTAKKDINDVWTLEDSYISGEGDFEICALDNSGNSPLSINVYDASYNLVLEMQAYDAAHFSENDALAGKELDTSVDINPLSSEHYENTLYVEKDYSGSVFRFEFECEETPKKEDFWLSYLCISTPKGDIDLVGELIFRSEILWGELESGKHQGTYATIFTSEGESLESER